MKLRTLTNGLRTLKPRAQQIPTPSRSYGNLYAHRAWRRRRERHLRDEPLCRLCFHVDGLYIAATVADHIRPHKGDRDAFFNGELASLCKSCHDSRKKAMENTGDFSLPPPVTPPNLSLVV